MTLSHDDSTINIVLVLLLFIIKKSRAVNVTPSQSYRVLLAIWDHTMLPASRHKWTHPALTPARQAGTRFSYPGGMEGW